MQPVSPAKLTAGVSCGEVGLSEETDHSRIAVIQTAGATRAQDESIDSGISIHDIRHARIHHQGANDGDCQSIGVNSLQKLRRIV